MVAVLALYPVIAGAALTVIYDSGDTQPIAPFLEAFEAGDDFSQQSPVIKKPQLGAADPESLLVWSKNSSVLRYQHLNI
jgi:hypothetical protein